MKIIDAQQSQSLDKATIEREPISSLELMERAGAKITQKIISDYDSSKKFVVLCGNGNNGGDGLVIARHLILRGYDVMVYRDWHKEKYSAENIENLKKLEKITQHIYRYEELKEFENTIWIDAMFGSGLTRPLTGFWACVVDIVNGFQGAKIAIDIPSGLETNNIPSANSKIFKAYKTYTIGQPKLTFFFAETGSYIGALDITDIGLDRDFLERLDTPYHYLTADDAKAIYRPRQRISHKGTYGHALLIAGSYGKMGAASIAVETACRAGAGLVTSYVPKCGYEIMQTLVPEAMCLTDKQSEYIENFPNITSYKSIGVGCGLGINKNTASAFTQWIKATDWSEKNLVIDADGLNILSQNKKFIAKLPPNTILTPHPKEFERLTHKTSNSLERLELAQKFAKEHQLILVLKDAYTCIINSDAYVQYNTTGNAALASGGSGDSLTGIITALLAQGYLPLQAATLGVWLHGKSADIGTETIAKESFGPADIYTHLSAAFKSLSYDK